MMNVDQSTYDNKRLKKADIETLTNHSIKIVAVDQIRRTKIKVRASNFKILTAQRCISPLAMLVDEKLAWEKITSSFFYYEKELIEFALHCLYLTNTILGECIVQRCQKKDLAVVEIQPLSVKQLTKPEKQRLEINLQAHPKSTGITYGCDLEFMLLNKQTNNFIRADLLPKYNQIGFDDAICLNGEGVSHPIFEMRPKPANNMAELYGNLLLLYQKLTKEASLNKLALVTATNLHDRFFLGGHIHFGNVPLTFHHVQLLDQFLAIPLSLVESNPSYKRRNNYGRLGSVRKNKFNGFEYRVLPTWLSLIPEYLPVLQWIEFLLENAAQLPSSKIAVIDVKAYYHIDVQQRSLEEWVNENKDISVKIGGENQFLSFVSTLRKLARNYRDIL
ncbi:hypothetical protein RJD24_12965 [Bacillaceae bacterium IKA-2]|nr:hypothetical protein RJD24_12965 [Bacillaceae bacterium IKA-2]